MLTSIELRQQIQRQWLPNGKLDDPKAMRPVPLDLVYFDCYDDVHRLKLLMNRAYLELDFEHRAAAIKNGRLRNLMCRIVEKYFRQFE